MNLHHHVRPPTAKLAIPRNCQWYLHQTLTRPNPSSPTSFVLQNGWELWSWSKTWGPKDVDSATPLGQLGIQNNCELYLKSWWKLLGIYFLLFSYLTWDIYFGCSIPIVNYIGRVRPFSQMKNLSFDRSWVQDTPKTWTHTVLIQAHAGLFGKIIRLKRPPVGTSSIFFTRGHTWKGMYIK